MDEVREKLRKIGSLQRRIVLWLGDEQGITSVSELRKRRPAEKVVTVDSDYAKAVRGLAGLSASVGRGQNRVVPTEYAPYLEDSYFYGDKTLLDKGWTLWSPEKVLGHTPLPAESTSLSKGVRSLEERGLIELKKTVGKKQRISHLKLTFYGEVATVLLRINK